MRCFGSGDPLYELYHDEEWGRPLGDERAVFERLSLESFQSGLSWITILRKREAFRRAFFGFHPERVAAMDGRDVERLLSNEDIVRNRAKIEATISNAGATVDLHEGGRTLSYILWRSASPPGAAPGRPVKGFTEAAKSLSKELKGLGFKFLGPTTAYAAMQAIGVVNDHLPSCHVREEVERLRAEYLPRRSVR